MINTQYINLNMTPSGVMPVLYVSQYDVGRPLGMVVYNGGEAVDLSTYTVTIEGTRTDGTPITAAVTTNDNIGAFVTTATMTNKADKYLAKLVLFDSNSHRVASLAFVMCVTPKTMDENAESIEEDKSLYQQYTGTVQTLIAEIRSDLAAEVTRAKAAEASLRSADASIQSSLASETSARQSADQTLTANLASEVSARQTADSNLQSAIASEASTRATQDASLQSQINQLIAPSGEAPSAAEVENARVGADGTVYATLGDAIRTQDTHLKNNLVDYNCYNLCDLWGKHNKTSNGITYTWIGDGSCHVSGTATATTVCDLFISQSAMPEGITAGDVLDMLYSTEGGKVHFILYDYSNGNITILLNSTGSGRVVIPDTCTGMIIRLWVAKGTAVDEVVKPVLLKAEKDISNAIINMGNVEGIISNANDVDDNSVYFVSLINGQPNVTNVPYAACWLETETLNTDIAVQKVYPYEPDKRPVMMRSKKRGGTWSEWVSISEKGYIESVDVASADESGKTDMRSVIQNALDTYGYCKLGPGAFYISNAIWLPQGATLEGCGEATELRLLSGEHKSAINLTKYNNVQNLSIIGSYTDLAESDFESASGSRYGIQYYKGASDTYTTAYCCIENVNIRNFTGSGIYQYGTGANVEQGLFVSNVHIRNCWCGIHNDANSEFCRYVNVQITYCYIACINNGGNNSFENCVFHAYTIGMQIIGSRNNSAHGMCSNSSFCHTGGNIGSALTLTDIANGYVFSACQYWYNSIDISNCGGVVFNGCEIGRNVPININGGDTVMFGNCVFMNDVAYPPAINVTDNDKVKFNGCYGSVSGNLIEG